MKRLSGYLNEQQQAIYFPLVDSGQFTEEQLKIIKESIEYNLDVTNLANPNYSVEQMRVLQTALFNNIDLTQYVSYTTPSEKMKEILDDLVYDALPDYFKVANFNKSKRLIKADLNYPQSAYEWVSNKVEELKQTNSNIDESELYHMAWNEYKD